MTSRIGPRSSPSLKPHSESSVSPPSSSPGSSPKAVSKPCLLIREPSFALGCESIFEVQSTKQNGVAAGKKGLFYAGTSLNSSQLLSPQDVFPLSQPCDSRDMLGSTDFAVQSNTPKVYVATKQPITTLFNSSVVHPPDFPDNDIRRQGVSSTRTVLAQRLGRLKKPSEGEGDRLRGVSSPSLERNGTGASLRRTPLNQAKQKAAQKRGRSRGAIFSPVEFAFNSAYLPTIKTFEMKKATSQRKPVRTPASKRPKSLTPESRFS